MGSSTFAVPSLKCLLARHHRVLAVVTQPDRPRGRGQQISPSPVKAVALAHQLPVLQPVSAKEPRFFAQITAFTPDIIIVVAYGQVLPATLLSIPPRGCVNVHASLLPKFRGAAPIQWALMRGERVTGITIMLMDETLDTGPVLLQSEIPIDCMAAGVVKPVPQDHSQATYASKLRKEDGIIRWEQSAITLANLIRGVTPWPGAFTTHAGTPLKICRAHVIAVAEASRPGYIARLDAHGAWIETGAGYLILEEVQPPGRRAMDIAAYARGHALRLGDVLGP
ncbi:MAG: methionyl-tRNA formyltransferase [Nitrospinae bacterium]|nr:methionyl-tRNA formyltransferase [Nitrospinota bacterium]